MNGRRMKRVWLFGVGCMGLWSLGFSAVSTEIPYPSPKPGLTPTLFAPHLINDGMQTRDLTMSPDGREFYYTVVTGRFRLSCIVGCRMENGRWTEPELVAGLDNPSFQYLEPHISPDGQKFFFVSNLQAPGKEFAVKDKDIWVMERRGAHWGEPRNLGAPVNTAGGEFFPSTTLDGTV